MRIEIKKTENTFEAKDEKGNIIFMSGGGSVVGPGASPMQLLIMGLGGCSAIDVVLILEKQKQIIDAFEITIDAEREQDKTPALWKEATVHFKLSGTIEKEKAERAAQLSMEKYCSVAKTLELGGTKINYKVSVNKKKV